jgi:MOSC domain-containing protein YiiM
MHAKLHDELKARGFNIKPSVSGEYVTTRGVDMLALPTYTKLCISDSAVIQVTGLRNPCKQLDDFQVGLMSAVLDRDAEGNLIRKAGIMAIVLKSGEVKAGDAIRVVLPTPPFMPLQPV